MNAIREKILEIESLLKSGREGCLDFYELAKYELNKTYLIENEIVLQKIDQTGSKIRFIATLPPGAEFKAHCHNCLEVCTVLSGQIFDPVKRLKIAAGGVLIFERGEHHEPKNLSKYPATLLIDFYK